MRRAYRVAVVIALTTILLTGTPILAWGNPVPGLWEKVAESKPGAKITVLTKDGFQQDLRYQTIDDQFLTCTDRNDNEHRIELIRVDKIVWNVTSKYAKKGALWGAVGGAVVGGIGGIGIGFASDAAGACCNEYSTSKSLLAVGLVVGILAGLGAAGGYAIGAAVGAPGETIYISKEAAAAKQ